MTNLKRRECNTKKFGARMADFGVVVEKIWLKEEVMGVQW
jgi:hypothetical protein